MAGIAGLKSDFPRSSSLHAVNPIARPRGSVLSLVGNFLTRLTYLSEKAWHVYKSVELEGGNSGFF